MDVRRRQEIARERLSSFAGSRLSRIGLKQAMNGLGFMSGRFRHSLAHVLWGAEQQFNFLGARMRISC